MRLPHVVRAERARRVAAIERARQSAIDGPEAKRVLSIWQAKKARRHARAMKWRPKRRP